MIPDICVGSCWIRQAGPVSVSPQDEFINGTDPTDDDSDNDGLLDGVETNTGTFNDANDTGTDPNDDDSDDDGLNDNDADDDFSMTLMNGTTVVSGGINEACGVGNCSGGTTECNATDDGIVCSTETDGSSSDTDFSIELPHSHSDQRACLC